MSKEENYLDINRQSWNARTRYHVKSDFYDMAGFLKGRCSLNPIELKLLGDINGKSILHLQCHFGQDTLSLARRGAKVTGVDFSDLAIDFAKETSTQLNLDARFICCDLYDLPIHLEQPFDLVFASYGTIGWLPDIDKWAAIVARYLKPGGKFIFAEFHPVVWMFDDDFSRIEYHYSNSGAIIDSLDGTYADREADLHQEFICWNHGLAEVIGSLLKNGLQINSFEEFDYSPYNCFKGTVEIESGKYRIAHLCNKIPMVYSLMATKI